MINNVHKESAGNKVQIARSMIKYLHTCKWETTACCVQLWYVSRATVDGDAVRRVGWVQGGCLSVPSEAGGVGSRNNRTKNTNDR